MATILKRWGLQRVTSDHYAAEFVDQSFKQFGIASRKYSKPKSQLYLEMLPVISASEIELLDHPHLIRELCGLERRTRSGGKDHIDHPPRAHDDSANAIAGVAMLCSSKVKKVGAAGF